MTVVFRSRTRWLFLALGAGRRQAEGALIELPGHRQILDRDGSGRVFFSESLPISSIDVASAPGASAPFEGFPILDAAVQELRPGRTAISGAIGSGSEPQSCGWCSTEPVRCCRGVRVSRASRFTSARSSAVSSRSRSSSMAPPHPFRLDDAPAGSRVPARGPCADSSARHNPLPGGKGAMAHKRGRALGRKRRRNGSKHTLSARGRACCSCTGAPSTVAPASLLATVLSAHAARWPSWTGAGRASPVTARPTAWTVRPKTSSRWWGRSITPVHLVGLVRRVGRPERPPRAAGPSRSLIYEPPTSGHPKPPFSPTTGWRRSTR